MPDISAATMEDECRAKDRYGLTLADHIDLMMGRMYAAQEQRWADEEELEQAEYEIELRRRPGPVPVTSRLFRYPPALRVVA